MNARIPIFNFSEFEGSPTQNVAPIGLTDLFSRQITYARISITDLCNFKCVYCLPNGYEGKKKKDELSVREIGFLAEGLAKVGVKKIRITGGEPSLRPDLPQIIETIKNTAGIEQVTLTTNGYRLHSFFPTWQKAGLDALNISIDSFLPKTFAQITGMDLLPEILQSIDAILESGFSKIKVNAVLMQTGYEHLLEHALEFIQHRPISVRFIELMQTGAHREFFKQEYLTHKKLEQELAQKGFKPDIRSLHAGPAVSYSHPSYIGKLGIIAPYHDGFCETCNRVRVTSVGKLHLCLYDCQAHDLRPFLNEDQAYVLQEQLQSLIQIKPEGHHLADGNSGLISHLAQIGG